MASSRLESYLKSFQADSQLQSFQEPIHEDLVRMQRIVRGFFDSRIPLVNEVGEHLLGMAGKRFRPALTLLIARMGKPRQDPAFAAAVIELIHTATLVHDDTIDKSALRRGLPTINALYNDLVATILGDYIYTKVFAELLDRHEDRIVRTVAQTTYQMSVGEMLQIQQKRNLDLTEADYLELIDAKTASLMAASCEVGALIAGFPPERIEAFRAFGMELGRAYQITDDVFDYVGNSAEMGKLGHSDLAEGKVTLPLIRLRRQCRPEETERLRQVLGRNDLSAADWESVLEMLRAHDSLGECRQMALEAAGRAVDRLEGLPPSVYLDGLRKAVEYGVTRSH